MSVIRKMGFYDCRIKGKKKIKRMYWSEYFSMWQHTKKITLKRYYSDKDIEIIKLEKDER